MSNATETGSLGMRRLLISLACFVFLMVLSGSGSAATPVSGCTTISSPGVYELSGDILNSGATSCIAIASSNVVFDGMGYTVDGIDATNTYGVYVYNSTTALTNVTVKNLVVTDWYFGISYTYYAAGSIANNIVDSNALVGIYLRFSNNNTLTNNTASNNYYGIHIDYSSSNTLTSNTASNSSYGIFLGSSSSNTLTSNTASNNNNGILLAYPANSNTLTNNTASNNNNGILLHSSNNILTSNTANSNNNIGIYLDTSSNNTIYNNYFKNTNNFNFGGTIYTNTWNIVKTLGTNIIGGSYLGGNFWANPSGTGFSQTCTDGNGDGICDSSYTLASGNIDYLPLTVPGNISTTNVTNATICGVKFNDLNGNGVKDTNESGLSNWTIQVKYANGTVAATAVTNATGGYCVTLPVAFSPAIYVTEEGNHRIQKFDSNGNFILKWGGSMGSGNGQFNSPHGVAVDSNGNVYVGDTGNSRIQKFDSNGNFITKWGSQGTGDGQFNVPYGVAVDSNGNVYVADIGNSRIQKFDSNGNFITKWGSQGTGDGQFINAYNVAVDSSGNVYVGDKGAGVIGSYSRIQKFDSNGNFILKWGSLGSGNGQFNTLDGVAVDSSGNVYVADIYNYRIQKFNSTGGYITQWGSLGSGNGQFNLPLGVAVDSSGYVYVTEIQNNQRIQKFNSNGGYILQWGSYGTGNGQFNYPYGIAVGLTSNNSYTVSEVQQPGWTQTSPPAPGTYTVNLAAGQTLQNITFGNRVVNQTSTVCGVKFNDLNGNGVRDANESGLSNWTIQIKYANGTIAAIAVTNSTGGYCVTLPAGNYTASEVLQSGYTQTFPPFSTYNLNLTAGQTLHINFGNHVVNQTGCVNPPSGMVAWWPLDETSGTIVADVVAGFNGTAQPGPIGAFTGPGPVTSALWPPPTFPTGKVGTSLFFYGNRRVEVPYNPALDPGTGDFTVDAWVIYSAAGNGQLLTIVRKGQPAIQGPGWGFLIRDYSPAQGGLAFYGGQFGGSVEEPITPNTWHHVAATLSTGASGPRIVRVYVDGVSSSQVGLSGNIASTANLLIGGDGVSAGEIAVDEVEIFNRALTAAEVQSIYNAGSAGKCSLGDEPLRCDPPQSTIVLQAGENDNFNPNPDTPPASPRPAFVAALGSVPLVGFDSTATNRHFAHSFTGLPSNITAAQLEIRLKPIGEITANDALNLWFAPAIAESHYLGSGNSYPGLLNQGWNPTNFPNGHVFLLNLSPAIVSGMNANGFLDIQVQDDTSVDYVILRICAPKVTGCVTPPPNMVAWWPLDESSGATSLEDIILGNDAMPFASPVGAAQGPQPVAGVVGGAIHFPKFGNGLSGSRVSPQGTLATIGSADFTIDAWVKFAPAPANKLHYIVNKFDSTQNKGYAFYIVSPGITGNERLEFKWGDGSNVATVQSISPIATAQWHHVAVTFARNVGGYALDIRLYVDGTQQGQQVGNPPGLGSLVNFIFLEIGQQPSTIDEAITIDELEIFDRALSQTEIQTIANAKNLGKCKPAFEKGKMEQEDLDKAKATVSDFLNQVLSSSPVFKTIFGNERMNVYVEGLTPFNIVTQNGKIESINEGEIEAPTMKVYAGMGTVNQLIAGEITPLDALQQGKIRYEGVGLVKSIKFKVLGVVSGLLSKLGIGK